MNSTKTQQMGPTSTTCWLHLTVAVLDWIGLDLLSGTAWLDIQVNVNPWEAYSEYTIS